MAATSPPPQGSRAPSGAGWAAGAVTRRGLPTTITPPVPPPVHDGRDRRQLWWFGGAAGAVLVIGLVVVLGLTLSGDPDFLGDTPGPPVDARPPLARMCPSAGSVVPPPQASPAVPPTGPSPAVPPPPASPGPPAGPPPAVGPGQPPAGERTVDTEAGISYPTYGEPWRRWPTVWNAGSLEVPYAVGQHFVTERSYNGYSDYHASILSAAVPAADNDAMTFDLECVGRQVAADARAEYYPQPNRLESLRDERTNLGGLPAWVTVFRLHFTRPGLRAGDELVGIACIDVGRATAAILYISIPGTHRQFDWVVEHALASVRPA